MRLLLVEHDAQLAVAIRDVLEGEGWQVVVERSGEGGFFRGVTESFDVLLLDVTHPGRTGWRILAALRHDGVTTPVLMIVGAGEPEPPDESTLASVDLLPKPFATAELVERVWALGRRNGPDSSAVRSHATESA